MDIKTIDEKTFASGQLVTRQIVGEILNFGVSQQQILSICYLLSLELEDHMAVKEISTCIDRYLNKLANKEDNKNDSKKDNKENAIITDF